jgi:TetR/AcrR family transcriptional regulator, lmrAB and yxaGH operons repressor
MTIEAPTPNTRDRLISAMLGALRTRGYHGVGLNELLATAGAPKGVLYHHFPGGKAELAVAAINAVVAHLCSDLDKLLSRDADPVLALGAWMTSAQKALEKSGFDKGCPLATVALESTSDDAAIRLALAEGFEAIRARLTTVLLRAGMKVAAARACAALIVSAYEGALIQARVAGNSQPMRDASAALIAMVQLSLLDSAKDSAKASPKASTKASAKSTR